VGEPARPHVYVPFARNSDGAQNIIVETTADPETIRKAIASVNAAARVYQVQTLDSWVDRSYWQVRFEVDVLGAFAVLALLLAAVGLYGMISYHVTLRRREIGIRMAVGARAADVFRLILRQGLSTTLIGVCIGLALSAVLARFMTKLLYGVSPADPLTYASVAAVWLTVAAAACYLPARRAACVDPTECLRDE